MPLSLHPDFSPKGRYLLGLSGGRDSVALLHALIEAGCRKLVVCHLNHQLRGLFSVHDASFARELAEQHELPFEIARENVQRLAESNKVSIEVAARGARHAFFADCAKKHRCNRVLLAHHADDNAETVLLNLLRGSAGLRGMTFETTLPVGRRTLTLIRPLLAIRRREIDAFLEERRALYRDDPSNDEPFTPRNRLRHEALPLLEEIMDRDVTPAILRATANSQADRESLDDLLEILELVDPKSRLFLPRLRELPENLQRRAIFLYLHESGVPDLSREVVNRCLALLEPEAPAKDNLPGNLHIRRRANRLFVE